MKKTTPDARLIVATPETCADVVYASGFFAPDPVVYFERDGERTLLLSRLELGRGRREARVNQVLASDAFADPLRRVLGRDPSMPEIVGAFLKSRRVRRVSVPRDFSVGIAKKIEAQGTKVEPVDGEFYPQREIKSSAEIRCIRAALRITEAGMARGMEVLQASRAGRDGVLRWGGGVLTSERLRAEIDCAVLRAGGQPANTIVAGGDQACDPHERGSGPLRGGVPIILDIFPRDVRSGYYGDLSRTVVRGRASESVRRMWQTVKAAQALAYRLLRVDGDGADAESQVRAFFEKEGYPTVERKGVWTGFFHGVGHGLGLEVHEAPRYGKTRFRAGQVLTVEPGLYYPGLGGVRIEDVARVGSSRPQWLSDYPVELEL